MILSQFLQCSASSQKCSICKGKGCFVRRCCAYIFLTAVVDATLLILCQSLAHVKFTCGLAQTESCRSPIDLPGEPSVEATPSHEDLGLCTLDAEVDSVIPVPRLGNDKDPEGTQLPHGVLARGGMLFTLLPKLLSRAKPKLDAADTGLDASLRHALLGARPGRRSLQD